MEKEKPKRKGGYRQNRELGIICALWILLIFFRLDELVGAVGLRHYYLLGSWVIALILLVSIFVFDTLWNDKPLFSIVLPLFIIFGCMVVVGIFVFGIVYFLGVVLARQIPSGFIVVGLLVSLVMWWDNRFRAKDFNPALVKWALVLLTAFTIIFTLGVGFRSGGKLVGAEHFEGHQYYLIAYGGTLGDSDTVILYECNSSGLMCQNIHPFSIRDYNDTYINFTPLPERHLLLILVGTELYRHAPS
jgi:hypothetical protein